MQLKLAPLTEDTNNWGLIQAWLELQCSMVAGVQHALILIDIDHSKDYQAIASWPNQQPAPAQINAAGQQAIAEHDRIFMQASKDDQSGQIFAFPVFVDSTLMGAFSIEVTQQSEQQQCAILQILTWGMAWLELLLRSEIATKHTNVERLLDILAQVVEQGSFTTCCATTVNVLAEKLHCSRVSLGICERNSIRLLAISNTAQFTQHNQAAQLIVNAMLEATDQKKVVCIADKPASKQPNAVHTAHLALQQGSKHSAICTLPIINKHCVWGAITLERDHQQAFSEPTLAMLTSLLKIIGPILLDKRSAQAKIHVKTGRKIKAKLQHFLGPNKLFVKVLAFALLAVAVSSCFVQGTYRVDAVSRLEGTIQRVVVTPFDGFVIESLARAGDIVTQDQLLCRLDDTELKLEQQKWTSEKSKLKKAQREAMAQHERSETNILKARLDQANAELSLVQEKLQRTQVRAPIAGIILRGDLSQSLGVPLERGQVLFEVAPLNSFRIMLEVDERDIGAIQVDQSGNLALTSLPHQRHPFKVKRILPISKAADGNNYFLVEAKLAQPDSQLRPGMLGFSKIDVGDRRLIWIWTHKIVNQLRLFFWSWLG